ncbi:MAG: MurR/RpiR family transcriptional regulator [Rhodospirillales bacterium]|jgi:DNA-binding MurR/RpiR family transcriptional regulator|nr:MurR/RpiR family transcriptional regulator [Rhodospirillales bacterium]
MIQRSKDSFLGRVRASLDDLHPAERRLGRFLCDFPGELASYSAQELAELANVSKATVSRFVRRLGFDNYEQARRLAREESQTGSRFFLGRAGELPASQWLDADIAQGKDNLERTLRQIGEEAIDALARRLLAARKVWVVGFRSSHAFAGYLQWQLTQVVENIVAIPGGGETLGEHLASVGRDDCVVVFALRRRLASTATILEEIVRTGADTAYVTDEGAEPRDDLRWHFRCQTTSSGPLFSHVSVMALCHQIISRAIILAGAGGRARLQCIEGLNDRLNEL